MKGAKSRTRLWIPATVSLGTKSVRITVSGHADEFKLHRLVWMSPESFLLTGIDEQLKFKRVHLRMPTNNEASLVASVIVNRFSIQQEPLSTVDEILVQAHFALRGRELLVFGYQIVTRIIIGGIALYAGFKVVGLIGYGVGAYVLFILAIIIFTFFKGMKLRVEASLKFENTSLKITSSTDHATMIPRIVHWEGPQTFLLTGSRRKVRIYTSTPEEAVRIVSKIKEKFAEVREVGVSDD